MASLGSSGLSLQGLHVATCCAGVVAAGMDIRRFVKLGDGMRLMITEVRGHRSGICIRDSGVHQMIRSNLWVGIKIVLGASIEA